MFLLSKVFRDKVMANVSDSIADTLVDSTLDKLGDTIISYSFDCKNENSEPFNLEDEYTECIYCNKGVPSQNIFQSATSRAYHVTMKGDVLADALREELGKDEGEYGAREVIARIDNVDVSVCFTVTLKSFLVLPNNVHHLRILKSKRGLKKMLLGVNDINRIPGMGNFITIEETPTLHTNLIIQTDFSNAFTKIQTPIPIERQYGVSRFEATVSEVGKIYPTPYFNSILCGSLPELANLDELKAYNCSVNFLTLNNRQTDWEYASKPVKIELQAILEGSKK